MTEGYYPVMEGNEWIYQEEHGSGLLQVAMHVVRRENDAIFFTLHYRNNRSSHQEWDDLLAMNSNGVFRMDADSGELVGPLYKFPLSADQQWVYTTLSTQIARNYVLAAPIVKTEAGTFYDCLRVETTYYFSGYSEAEWLAPSIGMVAYIERYESSEPYYRLVYFRRGDGSLEIGRRP